MFCDESTTEEGLELNLFFLTVTACRKPYYPPSVLANSLRHHERLFQFLNIVLYMWSLTVRPRPPKLIWQYNLGTTLSVLPHRPMCL